MKKSVFSHDYERFLDLLRLTRKQSSCTQEQLAERLSTTQSFISKCERGERRLDIIELRAWCEALDFSLLAFIEKLEKRLGEED